MKITARCRSIEKEAPLSIKGDREAMTMTWTKSINNMQKPDIIRGLISGLCISKQNILGLVYGIHNICICM